MSYEIFTHTDICIQFLQHTKPIASRTRFQTYVEVYLRSSHFWAGYTRSCNIRRNCLTLQDGTDLLPETSATNN